MIQKQDRGGARGRAREEVAKMGAEEAAKMGEQKVGSMALQVAESDRL